MEQQINQQDQCGNQQQLQQPVILCPVQYVYDAPMLLQQPQENQLQQNQIFINVKNPPPWIQSRPQNQIVYVQQLPNNYQPYIHPQMVQNPMYHPQMSYQIQPMLTQDNRQFVQVPNLTHYNTVQNPISQIQQNVSEESEKMPMLTQMLNQKAPTNSNKATNVNNIRPASTNVSAIANVASTTNIIRPITHNQQVQTDISANAKGRPRNLPPQIITINPMQQRQFIANPKQDVQMNYRPIANIIRTDVPQHIKTKIPSSISVKTINKPLLPRPMIRPFEPMPAPQSYYYSPIIMNAPNIETNVKNIMTNPENQYLKPNIQEMNNRATVPMQFTQPMPNVPPVIKMEAKIPSEVVVSNKQEVNTNIMVKSNINTAQLHDNNNSKSITESNVEIFSESHTQTEEKLIRNTVFVQARGRILNEKETVQTPSLKRNIDDRLKEENKFKEGTKNECVRTKDPEHSNSKYIKIEPADNNLQPTKLTVNSPATNVPVSIQTQQSRISNLQMNSNIMKRPLCKTPEVDKNNKTILDLKIKKSVKKDFNYSKDSGQSMDSQISSDKDTSNVKKQEKDNEVVKEEFDKENSLVLKEESSLGGITKKEEKITVLTHVLEGYIIQESNVAFPIQKPTTEKELKKERGTMKYQEEKKTVKTTKKEKNTVVKSESKGHSPWQCLNKSIKSEKEMEFAVIDKDDPFANIKKSTVESWTAEQLSSHLQKYQWTETASKLLDEEIDGESVLLVNKDQLVTIGVSELHAEKIAEFAAR